MTGKTGESPVRVEACSGPDAAAHEAAIASLRINVFREYPYLYDGSVEYEREYLRSYFRCAQSVCVLAWAGDRLVGVSTGLPMEAAEEAFARPFEDAGYPLNRIFYFGESVLLPAWRGQGVGHRFFDQREAWAQQLGGFRWTVFCAVERDAKHPSRPAGYRPLDAFWRKRGYVPNPRMITEFAWKEVGATAETRQKMGFWIRDWQPAG